MWMVPPLALVTLALCSYAAFLLPVGVPVQELVPDTAASNVFFRQLDLAFPRLPTLLEVYVQHAPIPGGKEAVGAAVWVAGTTAAQKAETQAAEHAAAPGAIAPLTPLLAKQMRATRQAILGSDFVTGPAMMAPLWTERLVEQWRLDGRDPMATWYDDEFVGRFLASPEGIVLTAMGGIVKAEDGSLVVTRMMALAAGYAAEEMLSARGTLRASPLGPASYVALPRDPLPLLIVLGKPLIAEEGESVDAFHARYMDALVTLYHDHVGASSKPDRKLVIV